MHIDKSYAYFVWVRDTVLDSTIVRRVYASMKIVCIHRLFVFLKKENKRQIPCSL